MLLSGALHLLRRVLHTAKCMLCFVRRASVLGATLLWFASAVGAHAIALSTTPAQNEAVNGPDVTVKLRFNSRIDAKRSMLVLVMPKGQHRVLAIEQATPPDSLVSEAKGLNSGSYILRWQVLAADGHITRGEVPFSVK
jgi:methionine-rich copper-binding protein CopC